VTRPPTVSGPPAPTPEPPVPAYPAAIRARNFRLVQIDSVFVGALTASGTFVPVFLVRLGASGTEVGLLSAISAASAVLLAIPSGRWLQRRPDPIAWYSALRLAAWSSYLLMGLAGVLLPGDLVVPAILAIWALLSIPSTAGFVLFPVVMDGVAGPGGRFDLLGRRWSLAGASTAIAVVVAGQLLDRFAFPGNFAWLLAAFTLSGFGSFLVSRRFVIPAGVRPDPAPRPADTVGEDGGDGGGGTDRAGGARRFVRLVVANRPFVGFELRSLVSTFSFGLTMPLLPLFYVREVAAPDAWIGIIGAAQAIGSFSGYVAARRIARRRGGAVVLVPAMIAGSAVPALLAAAAFLPIVAGLAFVAGFAGACVQLSLFDQLMDRIPREHNLTFVSVDQTLQNVALTLAPSLGGTLAVVIGVRWGLVLAAAVGFVAMLLFAADRRAARTA
jgi:hypothetical protein